MAEMMSKRVKIWTSTQLLMICRSLSIEWFERTWRRKSKEETSVHRHWISKELFIVPTKSSGQLRYTAGQSLQANLSWPRKWRNQPTSGSTLSIVRIHYRRKTHNPQIKSRYRWPLLDSNSSSILSKSSKSNSWTIRTRWKCSTPKSNSSAPSTPWSRVVISSRLKSLKIYSRSYCR